MKKEPIGLYIFRYILGFAIVVLLSLLYWSSTLVEEDIKNLRSDITEEKNAISSLRNEIQHGNVEHHTSSDSGTNLLHVDPFYESTLPKLLGKDFVPRGTLTQAAVGKPESLHPFSGWANVSEWYDLCTVSLTRLQFGIYETMCPYAAVKIEERIDPKTGAGEFWVFLRDDMFWQPLHPQWFSEDVHLAPEFLRKHPVTSSDFKLYFDAMMNPYVQETGAVASRTYYNDVEEFRIVDDTTFVVRWKAGILPGDLKPRIKYIARELTGGLKPLPSHVFKYFANGKKIVENDSDPETYRTNSVWAHNFADHWAKNVVVSCGPWIFEGMSDQKISFSRNPEFFMPLEALMVGLETRFKNSPENIWQEFKSNKLFTYHLQPDQLGEFKEFLTSSHYKEQERAGYGVKRLDYVARSYAYIGWNSTKPFFSSAALRKAMTMAIDRKRIVDEYLNGLGIEIAGPFYVYSPAYDSNIKPFPFDPEASKQIIESEGWVDSRGTGVREKVIDGVRVPFSFALTYFVKNPTFKGICEYIATSLKEIGVDCRLLGVDTADLSAAFEDKSFDAISLGWTLGTPPEDARQLWHSSGAKEKGSSNSVGFSNPEVDKIIEALDYEYDPLKRQELYHRFDAIIHGEQPYTFLYTPKAALVYREPLQNVFIPADRQDLVPGANVGEPDPTIYWIKEPLNNSSP